MPIDPNTVSGKWRVELFKVRVYDLVGVYEVFKDGLQKRVL